MTERAVGGWLRYSSQKANPRYPEPPPIRSQGMENLRVNQSPRGSVMFADQIPSSMSSSTHPHSRFKREDSRPPSTTESAIEDKPSLSPTPPSHSVAREWKRCTAPPNDATQFQGGRCRPRSNSLADPPLRLGHDYSSFTTTHPISLNTSTGRSASISGIEGSTRRGRSLISPGLWNMIALWAEKGRRMADGGWQHRSLWLSR